MDDCISRQDAIDALDCINGTEEVLRSLPSAERKKGRWLIKPHKMMGEAPCCSECGMFEPMERNFCPNCGSFNGGEDE